MPKTARDRLLAAIPIVASESRSGAPLSEAEITTLAIRLSSTYQQSGLTIDQIVERIKAALP
jgi:hypothetical protein